MFFFLFLSQTGNKKKKAQTIKEKYTKGSKNIHTSEINCYHTMVKTGVFGSLTLPSSTLQWDCVNGGSVDNGSASVWHPIHYHRSHWMTAADIRHLSLFQTIIGPVYTSFSTLPYQGSECMSVKTLLGITFSDQIVKLWNNTKTIKS